MDQPENMLALFKAFVTGQVLIFSPPPACSAPAMPAFPCTDLRGLSRKLVLINRLHVGYTHTQSLYVLACGGVQDMESLTTGEEASTPSEGGALISWRRTQVTV